MGQTWCSQDNDDGSSRAREGQAWQELFTLYFCGEGGCFSRRTYCRRAWRGVAANGFLAVRPNFGSKPFTFYGVENSRERHMLCGGREREQERSSAIIASSPSSPVGDFAR